jgi:hypothetical protein
MAVVQLTNYDDFKLMVAANSGVYYWLDQQRAQYGQKTAQSGHHKPNVVN